MRAKRQRWHDTRATLEASPVDERHTIENRGELIQATLDEVIHVLKLQHDRTQPRWT
jgi:hypothetical protein